MVWPAENWAESFHTQFLSISSGTTHIHITVISHLDSPNRLLTGHLLPSYILTIYSPLVAKGLFWKHKADQVIICSQHSRDFYYDENEIPTPWFNLTSLSLPHTPTSALAWVILFLCFSEAKGFYIRACALPVLVWNPFPHIFAQLPPSHVFPPHQASLGDTEYKGASLITFYHVTLF